MFAIDSFFIVAGLASISSLIYSLYRSRVREKLLAYDVSPPVAIATALSPAGKTKLAILLRHESGFERRIESAYIRFLRIANFGRVSIRGTDLTKSNPLRIICKQVNTLDVSVAGISRSANSVRLSELAVDKEAAEAALKFEFLDRKDGATIAILTEGAEGVVRLEGDIVGMPKGLSRRDSEVPPAWIRFSVWVVALSVQAVAMAAPYLIYRSFVGSWHGAWLLVLPLLTGIMPLTVFLLGSRVVLRRWMAFPKCLTLPNWYRTLQAAEQVLDFEGAAPEGIQQSLSRAPVRAAK